MKFMKGYYEEGSIVLHQKSAMHMHRLVPNLWYLSLRSRHVETLRLQQEHQWTVLPK
jgi:hypothetical protein